MKQFSACTIYLNDYAPVEEPWTRVVRSESDRNKVVCTSDVHDVSPDWIDVVVDCTPCTSNHAEGVLRSQN